MSQPEIRSVCTCQHRCCAMPMYFAIATVILGLLPAVASQAQARQCITCASTTLLSRWYLTGFASNYLTDTQFTECREITSSTPREACSGPCFTYMFDDPDADPATNPTPLVVRGCHQSLLGVTSDRLTSGGLENNAYCEYDASLMRPDSRGRMVNSKTLVEFCGSTDGCNSRQNFPIGDNNRCSGQTFNATLNGAILECYDCEELDYNCFKNKCQKKYCAKWMVKLESSFAVRKSCSNVNVLGIDNGCGYTDLKVVAGGAMTVTNKFTQCYCKDKQYCNGVEGYRLISSLGVVLMALFSVGRL